LGEQRHPRNGWKEISEDGQGHLVITAKKANGLWYSGFSRDRTLR
jgi:hypothetical protein